MRRTALIIVVPLLLAAGSAPVTPPTLPIDLALARAQSEAADADRQVARLEAAAARAGDEASKLRAAQAAAGAAIFAAEARITAADVRATMIAALVTARRERLARQQRPVASLLAAIATMARRPPLLTLADKGSVDEFVRVRALLDATLPVIRRRTAALGAELAQGRRLERETLGARREAASRRAELAGRQKKFAELEQRALALSASLAGQSLIAGDVALARGEEAEELGREADDRRSADRIAAELAALEPLRAGRSARQKRIRAGPHLSIATRRPPHEASRSLGQRRPLARRNLAPARNAGLVVPADGQIKFAGPFHSREASSSSSRQRWMT